MLNTMSPAAVRLRLDEIIKDRDLTQRKVAEMSGISENGISKLVGNPRQIKLETINSLCIALGIDPGDLFTIEEDNRA